MDTNFDWSKLYGDLIEDEQYQQPVAPMPPPRVQVGQPVPARIPMVPQPLPQMTAIERKLALANTYRTLLEDSIFEDLRDPIVAEVDGEIRRFITGRLESLMGGGPQTQQATPGQFTVPEVAVLKGLVRKIVGSAPQRHADKPQQPVYESEAEPAPVLPPPAPPAEPKLRKRQGKKSKLGRVPAGMEKAEEEPQPALALQPVIQAPIPPPPVAIEGLVTHMRHRMDGSVEQVQLPIARLPAQGGYPRPTEEMMAMDASMKVEQVARKIGPMLQGAAKIAMNTPAND